MGKAYTKIFEFQHFGMCAELLVSSGLCGSHKEFWVEWAGLEGPIPQQNTLYVSLTMRNISMLNSSIGMEALTIDASIHDTIPNAKSDRLCREFETLHIARRLVSLGLKSEFSRN